MRKCEQQCGSDAEVYAGDRCAGGWAGYYCRACASLLNFIVFNTLAKREEVQQ
jgi:hypothetical protein